MLLAQKRQGQEGPRALPEVIIVSPYFPPSTLAGVHRARYLAKWLPKAGWKPVIICVDERHYEQKLDYELARLVPQDVEIIKVGALPADLTRRVGIGDIGIRAWSGLKSAIMARAKTGNARVVLVTGAPFYPMLLAPRIRRQLRLPVVLDFQDPWASAWGAKQPSLSKRGITHAIATRLEPWVLSSAAHITSVSRRQNEELMLRYPWLDPKVLTDIPIGADPDDFEMLRARPRAPQYQKRAGEAFTIAYLGTIWPAVLPTLRVLLQAIARVRDTAPQVFGRVRLQFIGTTSNPNNIARKLVMPLAEEVGVAETVEEVPQRLPFVDGLSITSNADANLLLGSDEPHYTPSKVFGILMAARPYISVLHEESSAHAICRAAGGGLALSFRSREELPAMVPKLADAIVQVSGAPESCGPIDTRVYAPFEASAIAMRFARIFEAAMQPKATFGCRE
jgi:hypothetical protein